MSRFQEIRARLETVTTDALTLGGVTAINYDNVQENPSDLPSATITLSFNSTIEHSMGCDGELVQGSMIVTVATPKQQGSGLGEAICQEVLCAWVGLNKEWRQSLRVRTRNIQGPVTIVSAEPRHIHTMNCAFAAGQRR